MEKLLNKKEVATSLGVTVKAIDKWLCEKKIPCIRLSRKCVRFSPSDLESFLRKHKNAPKPPC